VYWFWLNGNITREGITADLEAMKRVGVGGVLIMEVDQGAPVGPVDFMGQRWRELFEHVHVEAKTPGPEVNIKQRRRLERQRRALDQTEQSLQEVVWTETDVPGGSDSKVGSPSRKRRRTLQGHRGAAFPTVGDYRIPNIESKAAFQRRQRSQACAGRVLVGDDRPPGHGRRLTERMDASGKLCGMSRRDNGRSSVRAYDYRVEKRAAPKTGRGLECDKLSNEGIEANFDAMMGKLVADTGLKPGRHKGGLGRDSYRQLGERLAELDCDDARGVPAAAGLRPDAVPACDDRSRRGQSRNLRTLPLGSASDRVRDGDRELCGPHASVGQRGGHAFSP
jgi:hypothetical protein